MSHFRFSGKTVLTALLAVTCFVLMEGRVFSDRKQALQKSREEQFEKKLAAVKPDDLKGYYDLGLWCQQNKLDSQAENMFKKVLELSPEHTGARQKLGYVKYKEQWIVKGEEFLVDYRGKSAGLKDDDAEGHYQLATWCKKKKLSNEAVIEFQKTLAINPDHEGARKELGFVKYLDKWMTPEEKEGIINAEKGMVKYGGKWMKPEEMETLRQQERGVLKWEFKTKFTTKVFTIFTDFENEQEQKAIADAGDDVYEAFTQIFKSYLKQDPSQVKLPEIKMYYFETSEGMSRNCTSRGISVPSQYGFALGNESFQAKDTMLTISDSVGEVILHEGTHILDSNLVSPYRAESYWIIEGLACYFQSLQKKDGKFVIGERKDMWELRGPTKYHKLSEFCDYNRTQWDQQISSAGNFNIVYCQASVLFRFFMQAENGKYRDKFIREVVIGRKSSSTELAEIFGLKSVNDLEDAFIEFANNIYRSKISK